MRNGHVYLSLQGSRKQLSRTGALTRGPFAVTSENQATRAVAGGNDVLVVQGAEAVGHRASFRDYPDDDLPRPRRAPISRRPPRCAGILIRVVSTWPG